MHVTVADALAKKAKLCTRQQVWLDYIPANIVPLVSFDAHWGSFNKAQAVRFLKKKEKKKELRVLFEMLPLRMDEIWKYDKYYRWTNK